MTAIPSDTADQKELIDAKDWDWMCWFDGGRYDTFAALYPEFFDGTLTAAWNHDIGFTGDWCAEMLARPFPDKGIFNPAPIYAYDHADYDERDWFGVHPNYREYDASDVSERLAALGYRDHDGDVGWRSHGETVNAVLREHLNEISGGVVRYLHPHPPYDGLDDITGGTGKIARTRTAVRNGGLTLEELRTAYERAFRDGLASLCDVIDDLEGDVVITADHGECLGDCSQYFHARNHDPHDHLCIIPWFRVEEVLA